MTSSCPRPLWYALIILIAMALITSAATLVHSSPTAELPTADERYPWCAGVQRKDLCHDLSDLLDHTTQTHLPPQPAKEVYSLSSIWFYMLANNNNDHAWCLDKQGQFEEYYSCLKEVHNLSDQEKCLRSPKCTSSYEQLYKFCTIGSEIKLAGDIVLKLLGYGTEGIAKGSIAAWLMSVELNSSFLQTKGAHGLGPTGQAALYIANKLCAMSNPCDCGRSALVDQPTEQSIWRETACSPLTVGLVSAITVAFPPCAPASFALTGGCFSLDVWDHAQPFLQAEYNATTDYILSSLLNQPMLDF